MGMGTRHQNGTSPCGSCKLLRKRCSKDCIFAPFFPADDPQRFASVHKVFGASNVSKMLQHLPVHQRGDAVCSIVYEAKARLRDPVYGCVGAISYLLHQVRELQLQLAMAKAEIRVYTYLEDANVVGNLEYEIHGAPADGCSVASPNQLTVDTMDIRDLRWT